MFNPCSHCRPYTNYTHIDEQIEGYTEAFLDYISFADQNTEKTRRKAELVDKLWLYILFGLRYIGLAEFKRNLDRSKFHNRELIFFDEAKQRGVPIYTVALFGVHTSDFVYKLNDKWQIFHKLPDPKPRTVSIVDDKTWTKKSLHNAGLPTPEGKYFVRKLSGYEYGQMLGFPLVVKPKKGSLSKHVTTNITTKDGLKQAITIAKQYKPEFIVEKYLPGRLYRATVVDQTDVFICEKQRPHVVGNGTDTIKKLIKKKNANPRRDDPDVKNATLHTIELPIATDYLKDRAHSLNSVPDKNETVYVSDLYTLAAGCDIIECSDALHPQTADMFCEAARVLDAGLVGFDFICPDITKSWHKQNCGIIEANSKPYVDMHAYPSQGKSQPVAETMWNAITNNKKGATM